MIICDWCKGRRAVINVIFDRKDKDGGIYMADIGKHKREVCESCRDKLLEVKLSDPLKGIASEINWEVL